ncbi:histone-like nucleoid-structuring protein Lsr2 [Nocardia brasiliensis]|uniref:histone-like nucleoid-structuring protein Lsr2 n=1 Tax=Nocardia brasiliensis TaxID=37326 RepID=UPI002457C239|nr:Lsr2 family protein [Nocardia brasiliensis]
MAKKVIRIDDLDEKPIDDLGDVGVTLVGLNGVWYAMDLRKSNYDKLEKALTPFTDKARRPDPEDLKPYGLLNSAKASGKSAPTGPKKDTIDRDHLREWMKGTAQFKDREISDRGRIPADIEDAYKAANK